MSVYKYINGVYTRREEYSLKEEWLYMYENGVQTRQRGLTADVEDE